MNISPFTGFKGVWYLVECKTIPFVVQYKFHYFYCKSKPFY